MKLLDHVGDAPSLPWNDAWKVPSPDGWHDLSLWMATAWFEAHDAFHDGRLTSYLLRAFGHPNLLAYDELSHGNAWLLDAGDGWALAVRPFPIEASGYRDAAPDDQRWMRSMLQAHHVFDLLPVTPPTRRASPAMMRALAEDFLRPVRFRDVLINASRIACHHELNAWPEREDAYATANVVIDPRFRVSPPSPDDVVIPHPSRTLTG